MYRAKKPLGLLYPDSVWGRQLEAGTGRTVKKVSLFPRERIAVTWNWSRKKKIQISR